MNDNYFLKILGTFLVLMLIGSAQLPQLNAQGESCDDPIVIDPTMLPYSFSGNTADFGQNYTTDDRPSIDNTQYSNGTGSAFYLNGDDAVFSITPTSQMEVNMEITGTLDDWIGFWLFTGCIFDDTEAYHTATSGTSRLLPEITLEAGTTYFIVISTWPAPQSTPFNLNVVELVCTFPEIEYSFINDCDNDEFSVVAEFVDLGSEDEFTVEDNQGNPAQTITSPGTLTFGPYPLGTEVEIFSEAVGLPGCAVTSGPLEFACPPDNNDCADAMELTPSTGLDCEGNTVSATTEAATDSGEEGPSCAATGLAGGDVWFSFTATAEFHTINYSNVEGNPGSGFMRTAVYEGSCGDLTQLVCNTSSSGFTVGDLTIGQTYYIRAWSSNTSPDHFNTFDICIGTFPPPGTNDLCADAIDLTPSPIGEIDCDNFITATTQGATDSGEETPSCAATGLAGGDVWFSFTATNVGHRVNYENVFGSSGSGFMRTAVYEGSCGDLTQLVCNTSSIGFDLTDLTVGETYYIRSWSSSTSADHFNAFDICVGTFPLPPPNDDCMDATVVGIPSVTNGYNILAQDEDIGFPCGDGLHSSDVGFKGVWYKLTGDGNELIVHTCDEDTDHNNRIAVFSGDCDDLECVVGDYNTGGDCPSFRTEVSFQSVDGEDYYILVSSPFATTAPGNHVLTVIPVVCEISCPDDIVVSTDSSECTADVVIDEIPEFGQFCEVPTAGFDVVEFEGFDDVSLPSGWEIVDESGSGFNWEFQDGSGKFVPLNLFSGGFATIDSDATGSPGTQNVFSSLISDNFDVSMLTDDVYLTFDHHYRHLTEDAAAVYASVDNGASWTELIVYGSDQGSSSGISGPFEFTAVSESIDISSVVQGQNEVKFKFEYNDNGGWLWYWLVDNIAIATPEVLDPFLVNDFTGTESASGIYPVGTTDVTYTFTDVNDEDHTCTFSVTVNDEEDPVITCPANVTIEVDFGVDNADVDDFVAVAEDNCNVASVVNDYNDGGADASGNYPDGTTTVTFTATDDSDNTATCSATVTVTSDDVPPIDAVCQDATVELDADGSASVDADDLDGGSSGGAGDLTFTVDGQSSVSFDCDDVGAVVLTLTVTDDLDFSETCTATVTVEDNTNPTVTCEAEVNQSVANPGDDDVFVNIPLATADDNCGIASLENDFNSAGADASDVYSVGTTIVTYTAVDDNGNEATCQTTVNVEADLSIVPACQDASVSLDEDGNASVSAEDLDDGSFGGVGDLNFTVDGSSSLDFDCDDVGTSTVVLTISDNSGNSGTCESEITVSDDMAPTISCQSLVNKTVDNIGDTEVFVDIPEAEADDNCGIASLENNFNSGGADASDIYLVGTTVVTFTATDVNGNTATCQTTVIVAADDSIIPVCADVTAELDADGDAEVDAADLDGGSFGGDGDLSFSVNGSSSVSFDCGDVGANTVVLTVTDDADNSETCEATVTVTDNVPPVVSCDATAEQMVANPGDTEVFVDLSLATATDNCGVASIENDVNSGGADASDVYSVGTHTITYTAADVNGNTAECETELTVLADESLVAVCTDGAATIDASGSASLDAADLDGGSFGGDGALSFTVNGESTVVFGCDDLGENNLTVVVSDGSGNSETCEATVTIDLDGVTEVSCNSGVEVSLDSDGNGSVVLADLIASAEATCGIASMEASHLDFDCDDVGTASVEVTITNIHGDEATCTATVEVEDNNDPVAECLDLTFPIADEDMTFFVNAQSIDGGSSATCGDLSFSFDGDTPGFTCDDDGTTHTVTLVVTNDAGLTATCESEITVLCVEGLIEISGYVEREFGDPVGGVEMSWLGTPGGISLSQGDGLYQIFVDPNSNAVVTPQKDGNPTQYLSTIDLITLQRHILQIDPFTSPYRIIAGDATFDDVVSTFDLVVLQSLIIGIIEDLNGPIWRFIPASYTFDNPTNPFGEDFPEVKGYQGVVNAQTGEDWVAIKTGDVAWTSGTRLANQSVQFNVHAVEDNAGEQYLVFTSANDTELKGYQMALSFDRNISVAEFIPSAELLGMSDLNFHMEDDFARTNYYNGEGIAVSAGMELFRLRVNSSSEINNPLSVVEIYNQDRMRAEAYPTNSEMSGITLGTSVEMDDIWSVFKLSPVPAITDLMLELNTSDDMTVEFEIYNSNGQLMRSFDQNLYSGMNAVNLDVRDFAAGSYFIRIVGSDKSETIPFIKMD